MIHVSDGAGITAETLGNGLLSQFEGVELKPMRFPFLHSAEKAQDCLVRIDEVGQRDDSVPSSS